METTEYVYKDILDDTTNILFNKLLVNISEEQTSVKGFTGNDLPWEWRKRHLGKHQLWLMVTFDCNRFRTNFFFFHINDRINLICYILSSTPSKCGIKWIDVLLLAGIALIFPIVACMGLCFRFVRKTVLITD